MARVRRSIASRWRGSAEPRAARWRSTSRWPDGFHLARAGRRSWARRRAPAARSRRTSTSVSTIASARDCLAGARPPVLGDDPVEVVDVEEVHAVERVDGGIDRARHREVDEEHRPPAALPHGLLDLRPGRTRRSPPAALTTRSASGSIRPTRSNGTARPPSSPRDVGGALERAVRHHERPGAAWRGAARGELAHRPRAEQERRLVVEAIEDVAGELDGRGADRHGLLGDPGLACGCASPPRTTCGSSDAAPGRRRRAAAATRVLLLQLAEDLRLAHDHRVEARRDPEEMPDRLAVAVGVEAPGQLVAVPSRAPRARNAGSSAATASGSRPHATTSTRLQVETITPSLHAGQRDEAAQRGLEAPVGERDALAHLDRRGVMAQPDEDDALAHAQNARPWIPSPSRLTLDERDDDDGEAGDGELRGPAAAPARRHAALEQHRVERPHEQREEQLRIAQPVAASPRLVRPHDARDDAERQQDRAPT